VGAHVPGDVVDRVSADAGPVNGPVAEVAHYAGLVISCEKNFKESVILTPKNKFVTNSVRRCNYAHILDMKIDKYYFLIHSKLEL